jgi:hypothetical protein
MEYDSSTYDYDQLKQLVLLIQHHDQLYYTPGQLPQ